MRYWYVCGVGFRASEQHPDDVAFEISASMYTYCLANMELLDVGMRGGKLHISVDLEAYRTYAYAQLTNPDYVNINGKKVYDSENPFLEVGAYTREGELCDFDKHTHTIAVQNRNRVYAVRMSRIRAAKTPEEIDLNLRESDG